MKIPRDLMSFAKAAALALLLAGSFGTAHAQGLRAEVGRPL